MSAPDRPADDPRRGNFIARFIRGFGYLMQGGSFVFRRHPQLIRYCVIPFLLSMLVALGVMVGLYTFGGEIMDWIWPRPEGTAAQVLWYALYVFFALAVLILAYVVFFVAQALITVPFNDVLSARTEQLAFGQARGEDGSLLALGRDVAAAIGQEAGKLALYLVVMAALFVAKLIIPVVGAVLFIGGGFVLTAVFFAFDFMDLAMARRRMGWSAKWGVIRRNRALSFGFGSAMAAALLVPLLGTACIPLAAVGGTLLFGDLERAGDL